ncbi:MAG TPA: COX15/CtaA family protein [Kofleriaceae bacterium]|nr:COX15/CtaA family protein [Kofleriaceae bacterium]
MKQSDDASRATLEYRWALVTAAATFLLLMAGGLVNPTGSSLACPEAFVICKGELFPKMEGGVLFEHGHRLIAMSVGLLQLGLTVLLLRRRPALRGWAAAALGLVVVQALLGALTVKFQLPWFVSTAHLMVAMSYFALTLYQAWRTRPAPATPVDRAAGPSAERARMRWWIAVGGTAVLLQILLGGLVRHHGAALASLDLPLHEGQLWPAGAPFALKLHMAHRLFGALVGVVAIVCSIAIFRAAGRGRVGVRRAALIVPFAIVAQILLGMGIIATFRSVPVVLAHFGGAALLWGVFCAMWLMTGSRAPAARRADGARSAPAGRAALAAGAGRQA